MTTMNEHADKVVIQRALDSLIEYFDSVQIFCTRSDPDGTLNMVRGAGNWFARVGQIDAWLREERSHSKIGD